MNLKIHSVVPVLRVTDMPRSLHFYVEILGFSLCWENTQDGGGENAMLEAGTVYLLLSTGAHLGAEPGLTGVLYFNIDEIDSYFQRIQEQVTVVWPPETMDYGQREFGIRDPDGYLLAFAEPAAVDGEK
jgi:uncharacterized glyoxalase superfamily protein PhnB